MIEMLIEILKVLYQNSLTSGIGLQNVNQN